MTISIPRGKKQEKGSSKKETLEFYKQGMKAEEIAKQRALSLTTIETHLADFVLTNEVNVFDFVNEEQIQKIKTAVAKTGNTLLTPIKIEVGDEISYGQIRMALNYLKTKNGN